MKRLSTIFAAGLAITAFANTAQAADPEDCQIVIMETVEVEDASREAQIASFFPAADFINSATDDVTGHISEVNGQKIQALMCTRNEIIPAKSDYDFLATGIPFILSQDFDSQDTDSLTVKWIEGTFKYAYKGYPLSDEAETTLKARLAKFSERGLSDWAGALAKADAEAKAETKAEATLDIDPETDVYPINMSATVTRDTGASGSLALESIEEAKAKEITTGRAEISEATKLHVQTKN